MYFEGFSLSFFAVGVMIGVCDEGSIPAQSTRTCCGFIAITRRKATGKVMPSVCRCVVFTATAVRVRVILRICHWCREFPRNFPVNG